APQLAEEPRCSASAGIPAAPDTREERAPEGSPEVAAARSRARGSQHPDIPATTRIRADIDSATAQMRAHNGSATALDAGTQRPGQPRKQRHPTYPANTTRRTATAAATHAPRHLSEWQLDASANSLRHRVSPLYSKSS